MQISELQKYLQSLPEHIMEDVPHIVAETATEYFKSTFRKKAFDGKPWPSGRPKRRGSLLVDSGALMNSIRPSLVSRERVRISAGNEKVNYAQIHNEGLVGSINVKAHKRKGKKGKMHNVKAHKRNVRMPKRQFMGHAEELNKLIHRRIEGYIQTITQ